MNELLQMNGNQRSSVSGCGGVRNMNATKNGLNYHLLMIPKLKKGENPYVENWRCRARV